MYLSADSSRASRAGSCLSAVLTERQYQPKDVSVFIIQRENVFFTVGKKRRNETTEREQCGACGRGVWGWRGEEVGEIQT